MTDKLVAFRRNRMRRVIGRTDAETSERADRAPSGPRLGALKGGDPRRRLYPFPHLDPRRRMDHHCGFAGQETQKGRGNA